MEGVRFYSFLYNLMERYCSSENSVHTRAKNMSICKRLTAKVECIEITKSFLLSFSKRSMREIQFITERTLDTDVDRLHGDAC